jgi:predicted nucleic acid-binding protein
MKDKIFIDTNVLLYLLSSDMSKKSIAKNVLKSEYFISVQVLNEFANVSLKKLKISVEDTITNLNTIASKTKVLNFCENTIIFALRLKQRYQYQYYDCLILATALENMCETIYSEDMQNGQIIENSLKIINPFLEVK